MNSAGRSDRWTSTACVAVVLLLAVLGPAAACHAGAERVVHLKNAVAGPDFQRLPRFFTSDPEYDAFVNEYFLRHLSVDDRGIYLGGNEAGHDCVSFEGSRIGTDGLAARIVFRRARAGTAAWADGKPVTEAVHRPSGGLTLTIPLRPIRIELRRPGR